MIKIYIFSRVQHACNCFSSEMTVSKEKVISDKDLELLLDRTDLLGKKMLCFPEFNRVQSPSNVIFMMILQ